MNYLKNFLDGERHMEYSLTVYCGFILIYFESRPVAIIRIDKISACFLFYETSDEINYCVIHHDGGKEVLLPDEESGKLVELIIKLIMSFSSKNN